MILFPSKMKHTVIHRLHPFVKMGVGVGFTIYAMMLKNPFGLALLLIFIFLTLCLAGLPLKLRQVVWMIVFLSIVSGLNFWASQNTDHAIAYSLRLAVFVMGIPVLAATTSPQDMSRALSRTPLPSGIIVALLLVWRFFPLMVHEVGEMRRAAMLRGNVGGSAAQRFYRSFVVPMAFCVVEYADRITLTLELRGYSPDAKRTYYNPPRFGRSDTVYATMAMFCASGAGWLQWGNPVL